MTHPWMRYIHAREITAAEAADYQAKLYPILEDACEEMKLAGLPPTTLIDASRVLLLLAACIQENGGTAPPSKDATRDAFETLVQLLRGNGNI